MSYNSYQRVPFCLRQARDEASPANSNWTTNEKEVVEFLKLGRLSTAHDPVNYRYAYELANRQIVKGTSPENMVALVGYLQRPDLESHVRKKLDVDALPSLDSINDDSAAAFLSNLFGFDYFQKHPFGVPTYNGEVRCRHKG